MSQHAHQQFHDGRHEDRGHRPLWSILDEKGTQTLMKQVLGEAERRLRH